MRARADSDGELWGAGVGSRERGHSRVLTAVAGQGEVPHRGALGVGQDGPPVGASPRAHTSLCVFAKRVFAGASVHPCEQPHMGETDAGKGAGRCRGRTARPLPPPGFPWDLQLGARRDSGMLPTPSRSAPRAWQVHGAACLL